jgi:hypothetical protein
MLERKYVRDPTEVFVAVRRGVPEPDFRADHWPLIQAEIQQISRTTESR